MSERTLVERIGDLVQAHANAKQVYGDPVERDGTTIIPVARMQWGFGGGGLGGPIERGGGGGGVRATAIGYIELRDGQSAFRPIIDPGHVGTLVAVAAAGLVAGLLVARLTR